MPPNAIRWIGTTHLDTNLLETIEGRPIVSIGTINIDPRVTASDIAENIGSIVQIGEVTGREETVCALLSLCTRRLGSYSLS